MRQMYAYRGSLGQFVGDDPTFSEAMEGAARLVEFVTAGHSVLSAPNSATIAIADDGLSIEVEFVWKEDSVLKITINAREKHTISVLSALPTKGWAGEELDILLCKIRPLQPKMVANSYRELDVAF